MPLTTAQKTALANAIALVQTQVNALVVDASPAPAPAPAPAPTPAPAPAPSPSGAFYFTDVISAPIGGWVSAYKFVSPNILTKLGNHQHDGQSFVLDGFTFTVATHTGRVREATPTTLASIIQSVLPGDQILLRTGSYTSKYDNNGWNESQFVLNAAQSGTDIQPISIKAYPGETVTIRNNVVGRPNFYMGRQVTSERCNFWTISDLTLNADPMNIDGGGNTANTSAPESGGTNIRVVNCILQMRALGNVAAGQIELQGDNWKIFGNDFQNDYARSIDNLNHAIYVDCGSDNTEIAFNKFIDRREGWVMMVHQDGTPMNYVGTSFHHNYVKARVAGDVRGVSHSNVDNTSTMLVEDNYFENVGQGGFGVIACYRGTVTARRNTIHNCIGASALETDTLFGGTRKLIYGTSTNANVVSGNTLTMFSGAVSDRQAEV